MARFARAVATGSAHHITQRGIHRQRVFFTDADRRTYLECLATYSAQARARILAYCLMDNHIHLVAVPDEPHSLAVALRRAHGRYALYLNTRRPSLAEPLLLLPARSTASLGRPALCRAE